MPRYTRTRILQPVQMPQDFGSLKRALKLTHPGVYNHTLKPVMADGDFIDQRRDGINKRLDDDNDFLGEK